MAENLLKPEEVARRLAVTITTLTAWRAAGRGPRWVLLGGPEAPRYRYRPEDVEEWIERQARDPGSTE